MSTAEEKSYNTLQSLRVFLIRRFFQAALFIYVATQIINVIYAQIFTKIMKDVLFVSGMGAEGEHFITMFEMLGVMILSLFMRRFPMLKATKVGTIVNSKVPIFIAQYGEGMIRIYYMTIIVIIVLQLILTLTPYVLMGWWYITGIAEKVDELRRLDEARIKEEEKRRNLLFSDIVHDIKTPITTVVGYSRALNDGIIKDEDKKRDYLGSIYAKSMRISDLITMLFEFIKLDSAGFTLHKQTLDLAELLRENVITLFTDFEDKGIELDFDIPDDVCEVHVDKIQMSRVITNLLTNAIRYSNSGCKAFISMDKVEKENVEYYRISVADSGLEISREFAEHIFEPFSRSDEARQTTSGGSGLGLSIARKVATMHDGDLILDLDYGDGYTKAFKILVPLPVVEDETI